ncbi:hypothetical protein [Bacillus suaedaesalsae]|uniref:DUF3784 domain-containing protein n=1 Tax=Bacillus suaedaesalsae TaxID=2810349 RepID=A0ABS2DGM1_9BACI|nr:hypothetical protein [Bacillus suaedaesalsae]MBM6617627.1 hypothetical protein [Bacillus suaedaesalsae]
MTMLDIVLMVVGVLVLLGGLLYTLKLGKNTKYQTEGYDTEINGKVKSHPYMRNPVFLTYIIAAIITLAFIAYFALSSRW